MWSELLAVHTKELPADAEVWEEDKAHTYIICQKGEDGVFHPIRKEIRK
jgi:hypothetical protein